MGRLLKVEYPDYGYGSNVNNQTYTYYGDEGYNTGKLKRMTDASGALEFEYGIQGHMTLERRIIAAPNHPIRTFETQYSYDTWGRLESLTYPDLEVISYAYDSGGNLISMTGDQGGYIEFIGYDHFGQRTKVEYGNGTVCNYTYEPALRRLSNATTIGLDDQEMPVTLLDNTYEYDYANNITKITNLGGIVNEMGGNYNMEYAYDNLNRLQQGNSLYGGTSNTALTQDNIKAGRTIMGYDNVHRITSKELTLGNTTDGTLPDLEGASGYGDGTYNYQYQYNDAAHPHAVTDVIGTLWSGSTAQQEHQIFTYDPNGNMVTHSSTLGKNKRMGWDENNLMKGIVVDDVDLQHYVYNAGGERIVKSTGGIESVNVTGQSIYEEAYLNSTTVYPNGFMTISPSGRYTKHYYAGSERIMSRLMGRAPATVGGDAGGAVRSQIRDLAYLSSQLGIPDIELIAHYTLIEDCSQYTMDSEAYRQCQCEHDPTNCESNVMYYFHSDHLGSSSFLTDASGEAYQFLLYLPCG